jgi:hypothetical protein
MLIALCMMEPVIFASANNSIQNSSHIASRIVLDETWNKTYGLGHVASSNQTNDGGYILLSNIDDDVKLIKTDSDGNEQWNKTYGGIDRDSSGNVKQSVDGGYIFIGRTSSYGAAASVQSIYENGDSDNVWLVKTDSEGNELWNRTFGGSDLDAGSSVQQSKDGGYILLGVTYSYGVGNLDAWLIKTDSNGTELWNRTFGGPGYDWGNSLLVTKDDEYIIGGVFDSQDSDYDVWLIKTDPNGTELWNKTFGGSKSDWGASIQQTNDDGYVIIGDTESFGTDDANHSIWLIRTDSMGVELWNKTIPVCSITLPNVSMSFRGGAGVVQQTEDGGYIILGTNNSCKMPIYSDLLNRTGSNVTGMRMIRLLRFDDAWLIKTDSNGNRLWDKTFGGSGNDYGTSIYQAGDGTYVIAGSTNGSYNLTTYDISSFSFHPEGAEFWLVKLKPLIYS